MDINNKINSQVNNLFVHEAVEEAKNLFTRFDSLSSSIHQFEKELNDVKAYFPFRYLLKIETDSHLKNPASHHEEIDYLFEGYSIVVKGYRIKTCWYLSWESDETTKNFRLFLIAEEIEVLYFYVNGLDNLHRDGLREHDDYQVKNIYKEPFMGTKLPVRFQFSEHLNPFFNAFKDFMRNCSLALDKKENLPVFEDSIPF